MGAAASVGATFDRAACEALVGDRFDESVWKSLRSEEGIVTWEQLAPLAAALDAPTAEESAAPSDMSCTPEAEAPAQKLVAPVEDDLWVDPWSALTADALWAILGGDELSADVRATSITAVSVAPSDSDDDSFEAAAELAVLATVEGDAVALSCADDVELAEFVLGGEAARRTFSLDLSGTDVTALPDLTDWHCRELDLSGCEELRPAHLAISLGARTCASLLNLDLSFVGNLALAELDFAVLTALRRLSLEGCDLADLGVGGERWRIPTLRVLNVSDNALESFDVFAALSGLVSLTSLDARENAWGVQNINAGKSTFCAAALTALPTLLRLNAKVR